jgi:hydroxymethylbilane synthase
VAPPIRIGTRGSRLALAQTQLVVDALRATAPGREVTTVEVRSEGDLQPDVPLQELGIGVFTGALERALLDGRIDMAVHSLKDLPTQPSPGLIVLSVLERADPRDVLINRWGHGLLDLPAGARIGTSSPRREAQLRHGRSDLDYLPIRGNVETRIAKADGDDYDGVVIAAAGVERLGLRDRIAEYISSRVLTPAPGQGALALEMRAGDEDLASLAIAVRHDATAAAVTSERWVLRAAGAGCLLPIGALAEVDGEVLTLFATVTAPDGSQSYRVEVAGPAADPDVAGRAAYAALVEQGAGALLGPETTP